LAPNSFFADDPVDGSIEAPDGLGRRAYAEHLVTLLERVRRQSESSVLALIGSWGGGKSSVLEMTMRSLRQKSSWSVAEFNPWGFSDLDSMLLGFFKEISAALPEGARPRHAKESLGRFVASISPLGKLGGLIAVDFESVLSGAGKMLAGDVSPAAKRRAAIKALGEVAQPILVVLDDLDRLAPAELLLIFKLVRFVGRLPHVYYLLSYDEHTLLDVLARTDLCGENSVRAREYLEKIVQIRLDLPPLREAQAAELVTSGLARITESHEVNLPEDDRARFDRAYQQHLRNCLTTPRAINRYLAQVDGLYTMLGKEVDFIDFALLTFIRTFEPVLYVALSRMKSVLTVSRGQLRRFGDDADHLAPWRELLKGSGVSDDHAEGMLHFLAELFLPVSSAVTGDSYLGTKVQSLADRKAVGHQDYFDRYFGFSIPEEDLSDATVHSILLRLPSMSAQDPEAQLLSLRLRADTERLVRKMAMRRPHTGPVSDAIIDLVVRNFASLSDGKEHGSSQRQSVERLVAELLIEDAGEVPTRLRRMSTSGPGLLLAARLLTRAEISKHEAAVRQVSQNITDFLLQQIHEPFLNLPEDVRSLVWVCGLIDGETCREWLRVHVGDGSWSTVDLVGWLITTTTKESPDGTVRLILSELEPERVEALLGIDNVLSALETQIDQTAADLPGDLEDTPENRRLAALFALRLLRDRHGAATVDNSP
jgi:hypothetical protein